MPRYIDADDLVRILDAKSDMVMYETKRVFLSVVKMVELLPTADVVEVVRCCDCKYCETVIHSIIDEPKWFCTRMVRAFDVDPTSYCSYGERKEQNNG